MRATIAHVNEAILRAPIAQTVIVLTAEENRVAALTEGTAEALDGTRYDQRYHFLFELADGLITRLWEFNDTFHAREFFSRSTRRAAYAARPSSSSAPRHIVT